MVSNTQVEGVQVMNDTQALDSGSLKIEKMLMTYQELAEATGISKRRLEKFVSGRTIPFVKIGRSVRFEKDAVAKWLRKFRSQRNVS
jgi:excisionase family DNA binding protein